METPSPMEFDKKDGNKRHGRRLGITKVNPMINANGELTCTCHDRNTVLNGLKINN